MAASISPSASSAFVGSGSVDAVTSAHASPTALQPATAQGGTALAFAQALPNILYWIITFTSIRLPTWLFTFFSTSLTITMNATTLFMIFLAVVSTASWLIRYRYLNMYARLPSEPQRRESTIDLFPEVPEGDTKRGLSNYLDEFLSAIKVFGYLERPVFHELTRTMQTRKLMAGETLLLEEEQGFCLVVDGLVQIFVKSQRNRQASELDSEYAVEDSEDEGERNGGPLRQSYQLLTEVKNGAPMSSLFSILSLFTEDVKLRHDDDEVDSRRQSGGDFLQVNVNGSSLSPIGRSATTRDPHETSASPMESSTPEPKHQRTTSADTAGNTGRKLPSVPPLSLEESVPEEDEAREASHTMPPETKRRNTESAHPDIVARATVDTTIAIIPATAFRRLTRLYPRASAHIVQVILTRLQRVTLTTGHAYLGLTSEVLRIEKLMNDFTTYDLPPFLKGSALNRLKDKFSKEKERIGVDEIMKGVALHNPRFNRRRRPSSGLQKEAAVRAQYAASRLSRIDSKNEQSGSAVSSPVSERGSVNAGDLLANLHASRRGDRSNKPNFSQPFQTFTGDGSEEVQNGSPHPGPLVGTPKDRFTLQRQESQDEDSFFRDSITDCMLKAMGLSNTPNTRRKEDSVEQSPMLVSYDSKSHKAVFNNAFGFMDAFDPTGDGDSESMSSVHVSSASVPAAGNIQDELSSDVEIVFFPKGAVLVEQGERNPGLYYVIDGFLDISVPLDATGSETTSFGPMPRFNDIPASPEFNILSDRSKSNKHSRDSVIKKGQAKRSLYLTKPGGLAGYLGTISSRRSFVDVTAKTDVYVGFLPRASIERIVEKYPIVLLTMAKRLTSLFPRLILHIDFALEWVQVDAGQTIYHQGDDSDAIYIVLNGRLRMMQELSDGTKQVIGEYGQGDGVGELDVLTESKRSGTLHAIRDTELARLPKTLFNSIAFEKPEITIKISKIIATRMRNMMVGPGLEPLKEHEANPATRLVSSTVNLRTVGILPVTAGVPVVEFGSRLLSALTQIGPTGGVITLNQAAILNHLGRHAFNRMGKLKLSQHLADLEEKYSLVIYIADTNVNSPWTQTCISQADCILMVGLAESSPSIGEYERLLLTNKTTARKELVLLHPQRYCPRGLTRKWLRNRMWINGGHHHVHMPFRTSAESVHPQTRKFGSALKQRVQVLQAEIQKFTSRRVEQSPLYSADVPFKGDFHRLARRLTGKSVGLVLGGGGARGISHIGIIRALEDAGVPIDIVGGTSIGAFVGALYAWDADVVPMYGRAKKFAGRMGSMWRFALDLTYPSASYTTGHEFNRGIFKTFGTAQIEDFWLEFYCNTTNISKSRPEIHSSGYVWRYVRASMSLAGMVPPLCDENGFMLVDGGYLDNLTVEHMKSRGADVVFAIDVGSLDDETPQYFGDSLSGFWAVLNRWNPFSAYVNPPTLSEIQGKLAYVSSGESLKRAIATPGCRYMQPPIKNYGTLEFGKFEEIYQKGYEYGREYLAKLRAEGVLPNAGGDAVEAREVRRGMAPRRASI